MLEKQVTRREFVRATVVGAGAALLAACAPKATPTPKPPNEAFK